MKNVFRSATLRTMVGLFSLAVFSVSWQPKQPGLQRSQSHAERKDTSAPRSANLDQIDLQLNLDSVMQQVNIALAKIDYEKINKEVEKSLASIDYKKMNSDIDKAMKNIDWSGMKANVAGALDSAKAAINNINWDDMKAQIAKAQAEAKENIHVQKINVDSIKMQVQRSLQEAQKSLQAAKAEMQMNKQLVTALQKDGVITEGKQATIEWKNNSLYIDGVMQKKQVTDKYSRFLHGRKSFSIDTQNGSDL